VLVVLGLSLSGLLGGVWDVRTRGSEGVAEASQEWSAEMTFNDALKELVAEHMADRTPSSRESMLTSCCFALCAVALKSGVEKDQLLDVVVDTYDAMEKRLEKPA
jgi:hypothetical protein